MSTEPQRMPLPPADAELQRPPARSARAAPRRAPRWRMIVLTGLFGVAVYAATEGLLRLVAEEPPAPTAPGGAPAPPTTSSPTGPAAPSPETAPPGAATSGEGTQPAPVGDAPAPAEPVGDAADTNIEEEAEGGRRAAPPRLSDEEAPEFRESADNNISLPVDI